MKMDYLARRLLLTTCILGSVSALSTPLTAVLFCVVGVVLWHVEEV